MCHFMSSTVNFACNSSNNPDKNLWYLEIRNYWEKSKFDKGSLMPSLLSKNKTVAIAVKNYAKSGVKDFYFCQTLIELFYFWWNILPGIEVNKRN